MLEDKFLLHLEDRLAIDEDGSSEEYFPTWGYNNPDDFIAKSDNIRKQAQAEQAARDALARKEALEREQKAAQREKEREEAAKKAEEDRAYAALEERAAAAGAQAAQETAAVAATAAAEAAAEAGAKAGALAALEAATQAQEKATAQAQDCAGALMEAHAAAFVDALADKEAQLCEMGEVSLPKRMAWGAFFSIKRIIVALVVCVVGSLVVTMILNPGMSLDEIVAMFLQKFHDATSGVSSQ
jgi:hypothetical protein